MTHSERVEIVRVYVVRIVGALSMLDADGEGEYVDKEDNEEFELDADGNIIDHPEYPATTTGNIGSSTGSSTSASTSSSTSTSDSTGTQSTTASVTAELAAELELDAVRSLALDEDPLDEDPLDEDPLDEDRSHEEATASFARDVLRGRFAEFLTDDP